MYSSLARRVETWTSCASATLSNSGRENMLACVMDSIAFLQTRRTTDISSRFANLLWARSLQKWHTDRFKLNYPGYIKRMYRGDSIFWPDTNNQIPDILCALVKNIFRVKQSNDSSLLWHITIFQQNLPQSISYSKISTTEISFGTHLYYFE